ncbi:hypothetical protein F2Q69_00009184 [Brassica cretica]|uniref:Uncharacterized protein n=1 Tax=Brassica cretica TaxID=69181 RepID=A0A8S9P6Q1_BRACR|nr:hypothetical protein F2Q69_00009184 [Brassica cretica]
MPSSTRSHKESQLIFSPDPISLERTIRMEALSLSTDNNTSVSLDSAQPPSPQTPVPSTDSRSPLSIDNTNLPSTDTLHPKSIDIPSRTSINTEPRYMVAPLILVRDNNGDLHDHEGHLYPASLERTICKEARSLSTDNNTSVSLNSAQPPSTQTPVPSTDSRSPMSIDNTNLPSTDTLHPKSIDIPSRTSIDTEPRDMVAPLILVRENNGDLHDQEGHLRNAAGQFEWYMPSRTRSNKDSQLIFSPDPASLERTIRKEARSLSTDNNTSVSLDSAQPPSTQTPVPSTDSRSPLSIDNTNLSSTDTLHPKLIDIPSRTSIVTEPRDMVAPLILVRDNNGDLHDQEGHLRNAAGKAMVPVTTCPFRQRDHLLGFSSLQRFSCQTRKLLTT